MNSLVIMSGLTIGKILGMKLLEQRIGIFIASLKGAHLNLNYQVRLGGKRLQMPCFLCFNATPIPNIVLGQSDPLSLLHKHSL